MKNFISYIRIVFLSGCAMAVTHTALAQSDDFQARRPGASTEVYEPSAFDLKYDACLAQITQNAEDAYEMALQWSDDGGGYRAEHCTALSLFALERKKLAALRLQKLAEEGYGFSEKKRADFYQEAADFWLLFGAPKKAYQLTTAALKDHPYHTDLRITRARAYAALGHYDYATTDLGIALRFAPRRADAYRYRADAYYQQGQYDNALKDINTSFELDPEQVETAFVRGQILEAIRREKAEK